MKKVLRIFFCFLLLWALVLEAQERGVIIRPTRDDLIVTEPGKIATAVFKVTNTSPVEQGLVLHAGLPDHWALITREFPFRLRSKESDTQLVSFFIPKDTLAEKYAIDFTVQGTLSPSISDSYRFMVVVLPFTKLTVRLLEAPRYVIAGDEYSAAFTVTNESNVQHTIRLNAESSENYACTLDAHEIRLEPGETKKVTVQVRTDKNTGEGIKHHLRLIAEIPGKEPVKVESDLSVEMIPRITGGEGRFQMLPTEMTLRYVGGSSAGQKDSGFQAEIAGSGTLDEKGSKHLSFVLRGPDLYKRSNLTSNMFASHDEYSLNLWTNEYELSLGDQIYALSPLTENSHYGRGAGGKLNLGRVQLGSYYMKTRWFDPDEEQNAFFVDYAVSDPVQVGLNYLKKKEADEDSTVTSFESQIKPVKNTDINLEYARGETKKEDDNAYSLGVSGYTNLLSYYARYIHAEPAYPGSYRDMDFLSLSTVIPIQNRLRFSSSFRQEKRNLDLDPSIGPASLERFYQTGIGYLLNLNNTVSLDWMVRNNSDRLDKPLFDFTENTARLSLVQNYNLLSLYTTAESGKEKNNLSGDSSNIERYTVTTYVRPTTSQTYGGYLYYDNDRDDKGVKTKSVTIGLNSALQMTRATRVSLNYETKKYNTPKTGDRDIYDLLMTTLAFFKTHRVSLQGRYIAYKDINLKDEYAFLAEYIIPFEIPVNKKESQGTVSGKIYDEETKKGIYNAVLRLNDATTVTDRDGEFTFQSVKPGTCYLDIDSSSIGLERISVQKTPIKVIVEGGEATYVKAGITRSATLRGQVVGYRIKNDHSNGGPAGAGDNKTQNGYSLDGSGDYGPTLNNGDMESGEPYGIANAVVELKSESEILYRIVDNKGRFEFEELRPGKWMLNINEESLPEYYQMVDKNLIYDLKPGERREVTIRVEQKKRHIQIVEEKELPFGRLQTKSGEIRKNGEEIMNPYLLEGIHPIPPMAGKEATSGKSEKSTIESGAFSKLIPNTQNSINTREITEKNRLEKPGNDLHAGESREQAKVEPVKIEKGDRQRVWIIMILVFVGVIFFSRVAIRARAVKRSSTPEATPDSNKES